MGTLAHPSKEAYATILVDNHKENWPVRSQTFKRFVAKQFFDEQGKAMNSEALAAAVNLLEAKALFEGEEHLVHVRVAEHEGNIYLDLCNSDWQVVQVTPRGWGVVDDPPIRFRRSRGMLALPAPEPGGCVDLLRCFLNLDDGAWRLVVSWLVATLRPRGPYPIFALFAEQGSGKSTIGRLLRELVDPNAAPLRAEPNDGRDLMIAANNSFWGRSAAGNGNGWPEKGAYSGAERCRKWCRSPRIACAPTCVRLHRKRADRRGNDEAKKRKKPRKKLGFSHQLAPNCIGLQSGGGGI